MGPFSRGGSGRHLNLIHEPTSLPPKRYFDFRLIGSVVFAGLTAVTNRQTVRQTRDLVAPSVTVYAVLTLHVQIPRKSRLKQPAAIVSVTFWRLNAKSSDTRGETRPSMSSFALCSSPNYHASRDLLPPSSLASESWEEACLLCRGRRRRCCCCCCCDSESAASAHAPRPRVTAGQTPHGSLVVEIRMKAGLIKT